MGGDRGRRERERANVRWVETEAGKREQQMGGDRGRREKARE